MGDVGLHWERAIISGLPTKLSRQIETKFGTLTESTVSHQLPKLTISSWVRSLQYGENVGRGIHVTLLHFYKPSAKMQ